MIKSHLGGLTYSRPVRSTLDALFNDLILKDDELPKAGLEVGKMLPIDHPNTSRAGKPHNGPCDHHSERETRSHAVLPSGEPRNLSEDLALSSYLAKGETAEGLASNFNSAIA